LDSKFFSKGASKVGCKMGISVTDDSFGESKPSVQVVKIEFSDLGSRYCGCAREEYCASGTAVVDNCEDCVISFTVG